jgi:RimJ/RimL family protein N-acetyltransferase
MTPSLPADTERLHFRRLGVEDVDDLVVMHEDPLVARFMGTRDPAWFERYIDIVAEEWADRGHGRVAVVERESGRFVGRSGLKHWPQFDETEVGWALHASARGRGYATEAGAASLGWGFEQLGLLYVTANIQPANVASIRVAERLGMKPIRTDRLLGEEMTVYAISREEWAARSPR